MTSFFYQKKLKYFNELQNRNFSILWLKWTKQWKWNKIRHFSVGYIPIWHHISKISKYFNDCQNQNFSILSLKWNQALEMKQNQTFFHRTYSNLTSFFIGHKILKYPNDFYNWHLSISIQKWAQTSKVKWN